MRRVKRITTDLLQRYQALADNPDPAVRRMARAQLAQLNRAAAAAPAGPEPSDRPPAAGAELPRLIERTVGPLRRRPSGDLEGTCPWHDSRSGRSLVVFAGGQRWWCRNPGCRRGGDVVAWVALTKGISFVAARRRLGLPASPRRQVHRRPTLVLEVRDGPPA